jgi:hypothetical protein
MRFWSAVSNFLGLTENDKASDRADNFGVLGPIGITMLLPVVSA